MDDVSELKPNLKMASDGSGDDAGGFEWILEVI